MSGADGTSEDARQAERVHFESIVQAFLYYRVHAYRVVSKGEASFSRLPRAHQKILSHIPAKFLSQKQCIEANQKLLTAIVEHASSFAANSDLLQGSCHHFPEISGEGLDMDKIRCTLRQFVRDWSSEGRSERMQASFPAPRFNVRLHFQIFDAGLRFRLTSPSLTLWNRTIRTTHSSNATDCVSLFLELDWVVLLTKSQNSVFLLRAVNSRTRC